MGKHFSEFAQRNPRLATALWFGITGMIGTAIIVFIVMLFSNDTTMRLNLRNVVLYIILPGITSGISGIIVAMAQYPLTGSDNEVSVGKAIPYGAIVALMSCVFYVIVFDAQDTTGTAGMATFSIAFVMSPIIFIVCIASSLALAASTLPRREG